LNLQNRQDLINSLLSHLPEISTSLVNLVTYLRDVIEKDEVRNQKVIGELLVELERLMANIKPLFKQVKPIETGLELEEITLYKKFLMNISFGIKSMLEWMKDEKEPEEKIKESVDTFFVAAQQVLELVNLITADNKSKE